MSATGHQQLRAFIERILRLKEEQDALSDDIKEVYAEAKGIGFDKTALGEVVAHLRKVEKKGKFAMDERSALFDLYMAAFEDRASHTQAGARVRESIEEFNPAPQSFGADDGQHSTPSSDADGAKIEGRCTVSPERAASADHDSVQSEQAVTNSSSQGAAVNGAQEPPDLAAQSGDKSAAPLSDVQRFNALTARALDRLHEASQ